MSRSVLRTCYRNYVVTQVKKFKKGIPEDAPLLVVIFEPGEETRFGLAIIGDSSNELATLVFPADLYFFNLGIRSSSN